METTELEAKVYDALTSNEKLMGMLPSGGGVPIYHLVAPAGDNQRYPILVYAPTSDVPVSYGDDVEAFHRVTIRISIVTSDGQYSELNKVIREIMTEELEFKRVQTVPAADYEYKKIILNADYQITIPAQEEW